LKFGLADRFSNSGYRIPLLVMKALRGGVPLSEEVLVRLQSHGDVIREMRNGRIDAACVASDTLARSIYRDAVDPIPWPQDSRLKKMWTETFPSVAYGWREDLPGPLQITIENNFRSYPWKGDTVFMTAYNKSYSPVSVGGVVALTNFFNVWTNVIAIAQEFDKEFPLQIQSTPQ
jgi:ABC-type phosphate/phosphonate transport system substrate-binding protein